MPTLAARAGGGAAAAPGHGRYSILLRAGGIMVKMSSNLKSFIVKCETRFVMLF